MPQPTNPFRPHTGSPGDSNPLHASNPLKKNSKSTPNFAADHNRGPSQQINRNRTISGAPKTGRTPKR